MINVYSANTTDFSGNGIFVLDEKVCVDVITGQELNGDYYVDIVYPKKDDYANQLLEFMVLKVKGQLFRIVTVDREDKRSLTIGIHAQHIYYDIAFNGFVEDVDLFNVPLSDVIDATKGTVPQFTFSVDSNITHLDDTYEQRVNLLELLMGTWLEKWRYDIKRDNFSVQLLYHMGTNNGYQLRYNREMIGVKETRDMSDVVTRIYPTGAYDMTIDGLYVDSPYLGNASYPPYPIVRHFSFEDYTEQAELITLAQEKFSIEHIDLPKLSYKVDFAELAKSSNMADYAQLSALNLGDTVTIIHDEFGLNIQQRVVKVTYDVKRDRVVELELGAVQETLFSAITGLEADMNSLKKKKSPLVVDIVGGARVLTYKADGTTEETITPYTAKVTVDGKDVPWTDGATDNVVTFAWSANGVLSDTSPVVVNKQTFTPALASTYVDQKTKVSLTVTVKGYKNSVTKEIAIVVTKNAQSGNRIRAKGTWNSATTYVNNEFWVDMVDWQGSSYLCIPAENLNHEPVHEPEAQSDLYWQLSAMQGIQGAIGAGITNKGAWMVGTTYHKSETNTDAVSWNGSLFGTKIDNNIGHQPPDTPISDDYWELLVARGDAGVAGAWTDYKFRKALTQPTTPVGSEPADWFDAPPTSGEGVLWMSKCMKDGTGEIQVDWTAPVQIGGTGLKTQYSIDGLTNWHDAYASGDLYMRTKLDNSATWSDAIRIVGENGNYVEYIFQYSESAPATPTGDTPAGWVLVPPTSGTGKLWMSKAYKSASGMVQGTWSDPVSIQGVGLEVEYSVDGSTSWHSTYAEGDIFMHQKLSSEGTWGTAMRIIGENGNFTDYRFCISETAPATPTGDSPVGWSDSPPTSGTGKLYMIKGLKDGAGHLQGVWSTPVQFQGTDGTGLDVQYSVDGSTSWHTTFTTGDKYMRTKLTTDSTWSDGIKIVGEAGDFTDYKFIRSATQPATPTGVNPVGWSDSPPAGTDLLWMSRAVKYGDGTLKSAWSTPVQIQGTSGTNGAPGSDGAYAQIEYSVDGVSGWHTQFQTGDKYMHVKVSTDAQWSLPMKIVGEDANLLDWVTDWDGTKVDVKGNKILTPRLFAGINGGTAEAPVLTGLAIGRDVLGGTNATIGLVMYNANVPTMQLKSDGTAIFGAVTGKQIKILADGSITADGGILADELVGKTLKTSSDANNYVHIQNQYMTVYNGAVERVRIGFDDLGSGDTQSLVKFCSGGAFLGYMDLIDTLTVQNNNGDVFINSKAGNDIYLNGVAVATIASGGLTVKNEGSPLTAKANMNFVGEGVEVTTDATNYIVTINGGGGSSGEGTNADVVLSKRMLMMTDTRSATPTYSGGKLTKWEEKDGSTVIKTTNFTYNADGTIATVQEIAGGKTSTITISYASGVVSGITKVVV